MNETLTTDRILEAAEDVFRRFGPAKTNVVDVARALGVSHGSVYRHFASKAALRDAVVERWLKRTSDPLNLIATSDVPAPERLRQWIDALRAAKRAKIAADPELLATTRAIFEDARAVTGGHVATLTSQIAHIVRDGVAAGQFVSADPDVSAAAILNATVRFHEPVYAFEWTNPENDQKFEDVWALIMAGLLRRA